MFPESAIAHKWIDPIEARGGIGIEFGPASHNPFGFKNCIFADKNIILPGNPYYDEQMKLGGSIQRIDLIAILGEKLPIEDHQFDYIVTSHVLEHIWDLIGCFDEMRRILKIGGIMVHVLPHVDRTSDSGRPLTTWQDLRNRNEGAVDPMDRDHKSVFNTESFLNIVSTIPYVSICEWLDVDDKVGNGFLVVLKVDENQ